ncbi:MAG: helix-turn-helix domain-containing protein [Cellvibrionaceae bacterium]
MTNTIPLFALYGENDWVENLGFIHCEDIAKRSSSLGWNISAHRHAQLFQFLVIEKGHTGFWLDDRHFDTSDQCVIWIPPGVVHSFDFLPGTLGRVISFTEDLLLNQTDSIIRTLFSQSLNTPDCIIYSAKSAEFKQLKLLASQLEQELERIQLGQTLMAQSFVNAMLINIYRRQEELGRLQGNNTNTLWWEFKRLLDKHYREHLSVTEFADLLSITPSKLNRLSKQLSQKSVKFHTQQRLLTESKRKLLFTRQSIDEITYELGFKDPGYFCRFFKKNIAMTPGEFREKHLQ